MSRKASGTRARILEATWDLMAGNRGQGARMSDIARAAGVSRQALYLHFDTRADLLIAATRHMDEALGVEARLQPYLQAATGRLKMRELIRFWGRHAPDIQGMARALLAIKDSDPEARAAWDDRMGAVRAECRVTIETLAAENDLRPGWSVDEAADLFWAMLSFQTWDQLTGQCGWSARTYVDNLLRQAELSFLAP